MQIFLVTKIRSSYAEQRLIHALRRNLCATEIIFVIPERDVADARMLVREFNDVRVLGEEAVFGAPLDDVACWNVSDFPARAGWYYQQLVKLSIALLPDANDEFIVWDADTYPTAKFQVFDSSRSPIFTKGWEYHRPYFVTNERLLGGYVGRGDEYSLISQHMPVNKVLMQKMLAHLSSEGTWVEAIRRAVEGRPGRSLFSEYELYFDWVRLFSRVNYSVRVVPWMREGGALYEFEYNLASRFTKFIATEEWHAQAKRSLKFHFRFWVELLMRCVRAKFSTPGRKN